MVRIEKCALSSSGSVADALRLCIALGGKAGSSDLREWAARELRGYKGQPDLPAYRRIAAPICVDGVQGNRFTGIEVITGQRVSPSQLPDVVAQHVSEEVELRNSIGQIEELSHRSEPVKLSLPMGADVLRLMNYEAQESLATIQNVYWSIPPSALGSVVDQVRTSLVELMAEIRAGLENEDEIPPPELADQAVGAVIRGDLNRVVVNSARVGNKGTVSTGAAERGPSWPQIAFGVLVGLATIGGAVFAAIQLLR
jgi:hypothetical protein